MNNAVRADANIDLAAFRREQAQLVQGDRPTLRSHPDDVDVAPVEDRIRAADRVGKVELVANPHVIDDHRGGDVPVVDSTLELRLTLQQLNALAIELVEVLARANDVEVVPGERLVARVEFDLDLRRDAEPRDVVHDAHHVVVGRDGLVVNAHLLIEHSVVQRRAVNPCVGLFFGRHDPRRNRFDGVARGRLGGGTLLRLAGGKRRW